MIDSLLFWTQSTSLLRYPRVHGGVMHRIKQASVQVNGQYFGSSHHCTRRHMEWTIRVDPQCKIIQRKLCVPGHDLQLSVNTSPHTSFQHAQYVLLTRMLIIVLRVQTLGQRSTQLFVIRCSVYLTSDAVERSQLQL